LAGEFGIEFAAAKAVLEVESNGQGFLESGTPKVLFEAHWFSKFTDGKYNKTHPTLSTVSWRESRRHYKGGDAEYARVQEAFKLNGIAAWKSTSWGLGQVMGFNHGVCGYASVIDFVIDMRIDEANQFKAMLAFCKSNGLVRHLKSKDWRAFARGYNGSGYEVNNYHVKLQNAYQKWQQQQESHFT